MLPSKLTILPPGAKDRLTKPQQRVWEAFLWAAGQSCPRDSQIPIATAFVCLSTLEVEDKS